MQHNVAAHHSGSIRANRFPEIWKSVIQMQRKRYMLLLASLAGDAAILAMSLYAAYFLYFGAAIPNENFLFYQNFAVSYFSLKLLILFFCGAYNNDSYELKTSAIFSVSLAVIAAAATEFFFLTNIFYFDQQALLGSNEELRLSRPALLIKMLIEIALLASWRIALSHYNIRNGILQHRTVLVGSSKESLDIAKGSFGKPLRRVLGYVAEKEREDFAKYECPYLGPIEQLHAVLDSQSPNEIIVTEKSDLRNEIVNQINTNTVSLKIYPVAFENFMSNMNIYEVNGIPLVELNKPMTSLTTILTKRTMDIAISLIGLAIFSPVFAALWIIYRLFYGGELIYRQPRIGQNGEIFQIYKLRTMIKDAERESGTQICKSGDPRVLPIGWILRRTHLDELPQLYNVLIGDMSFVGPRPERPDRVERFHSENPCYHLRHIIRPGLTGLAQVKGRYDTHFEYKLFYDLFYAFNFSVLMDIRIIYMTPKYLFSEVFGEKNDY